MNSLVKVFSNFREFYNEINGATLTGAIDVIVVEQPNGEFQCSPFHVRFGKLGVLRSREKVVDIEINGEPVDIHMKLGDSGEAFFVEECPLEDAEELPENMATSPIPSSYFPSKYANDTLEDDTLEGTTKIASDDIQLPLPLPRRNSIDFSKETVKEDQVPKFENQVSDFSHRRHTDNTLERRNLSEKLQEYTTQKLRQEWAEHEEIFQFDAVEKDKDWSNSTQTENKSQSRSSTAVVATTTTTATAFKASPAIAIQPAAKEELEPKENNAKSANSLTISAAEGISNNASLKDESKGGKKKRRKKSQMKKKNAQRKSSSSSSIGSTTTVEGANGSGMNADEGDGISISNNTNSSSNEEIATAKSNNDQQSAPLVSVTAGDESPISETCQTLPATPSTRIPDLDIHFFSDTEVTPTGGANGCVGRGSGRPSTPIQSDSELEISLREKDVDTEMMSNSASWKWGQLPTPEVSDKGDGCGDQAAQSQAQRNSMLSGMFNFMKKTNKMRKQATDGGVYLSDLDAEGMDPEMAALYFPQPLLSKPTSQATADAGTTSNTLLHSGDDDRESGNGTSLPHSPSSMEGQKSIDSDYEDGKPQDAKYLDFVAMSLCGVNEKGEPSDEEFDQHLIKYSDVCENPSLFSSPNLVVRLNGKYYTWAAACPIVMTIITFQKPLTNDAIEQLMSNTKQDVAALKIEPDGGATGPSAQSKRSWWNWRRSQVGAVASSNKIIKPDDKVDERDADQAAVATQTTRPNSPDISENTLSKTDSTLNAENTSAQVENLEDLSQASSKGEESTSNGNERYKKSLRLSSEAIKQLNLKDGMNEIEFSVTTAYQGTTRCKCYLFRWKHNDKVVISDIDGTITKSDVLGHILPMVGKDWAQLGVAQLFSKIEQNGYKLLYLSARAIGQSRATREYLRSIRQGDVKLPDGPLLLNPTSLISAFHREVIERKPEQFKIACLSDIRELFPDKDPFYAGYGNRINDVWAYRAVGIPIMRIFTINTKGELKHELTQTFQSSGYINQSLEVDEHFPPLDLNIYEYRTDTFDDDEEEDELKFSETDDGIEDVSVSDAGDAAIDVDADNDVYLDYANENDRTTADKNERGLIMRLDVGKRTSSDGTSHIAVEANN
ncbi:PREDICTED: phosphatidate phosphatase LPIN2 isoform X1 [Rhagoletis zephyria]|uniref:phosphatidate phosphatase LPIN2 isoform X1 n=1 Tax=Rhagoletis zephyria TaxID=28612 RepID=UPI0008119144|nr:PREDICTED: phosphatidate phosphatase LPIN2 isoform X1 [Rhagoletis zephyria]XP_017469445.1 PREDICTED: phosphatidate phosphatase LPIN2 isoform X1 [Rhagoletis zephyria]XP_017469453.1 PREDICTED: phosphatidate phosphatase LPIN2 isoform X1 [Rhagoletis zephyria]